MLTRNTTNVFIIENIVWIVLIGHRLRFVCFIVVSVQRVDRKKDSSPTFVCFYINVRVTRTNDDVDLHKMSETATLGVI